MVYKPSIAHSILGIVAALFIRKVLVAVVVMNYVRQHVDDVDLPAIRSSPSFTQTMEWMRGNSRAGRDNFVLMLNRHALNMTANWLCMTKHLKDVHSSALFVTMDSASSETLQALYPDIHILPLDIPSLQDPFNYGDGPYQLFYLLRANLARTFLQENATFWMAQQDTYWRDSLSALNLSPFAQSDVVFDRASAANVTFIAGGYYRARPTPGAKAFFDELANDLSWWYAPDNAYMSSLCRRRTATVTCGYLPFESIPNWKWLYDHPSSDDLPPLLQFDGETKLGGKLHKMKSLGFYFLNEDGTKCRGDTDSSPPLPSRPPSSRHFSLSLAHAQFCVYQFLVDVLYSSSLTSALLDYIILPSAHFFMITM